MLRFVPYPRPPSCSELSSDLDIGKLTLNSFF